ncbi:MAG: 50S ribosomal protein L3 N(5)-glutamine methyltransferase [Rhodospirillaceae bacterium]|nr:50S ribosomal protein L3 N(5)-glutamine methyltransferase [Rhodospirillaceae bacterium]
MADVVRQAAKRLARAKLTYGHGTSNADDEAAFLVHESLGMSPEGLARAWTKKVSAARIAKIEALIDARIATRKPAPYLVGAAYIQGFRFAVDERVIVPRSFIGELLFAPHVVGPEASFIRAPRKIKRVLDLCTGSGCLAILAAKVFRNAQVDAVDLSKDALAVAKQNVAAHNLGRRVTLHHGDLFAPLKGRRYDLILTNPPYVDAPAMKKLPPEYRAEPTLALAGGRDGLDLVRRILLEAERHLTPHGALICEVGRGREALERAFPRLPFFWLDTAESTGEVFWLTAQDLRALA